MKGEHKMPYSNQYGYQQGGYQQPQAQPGDDAMGWDDTISGDDANGYEPLPEGDYYFTVKNFTRGRYEGGDKLPPCNKAVLTLALKSAWQPTQEKPAADGETTVNLFIVRSQRWKLSQFFISIGFLKPGEEKAMNWNIVPGSSGTCAVTLRKWTGNDGKEHTGNEVSRFYDPEKSPVQPVTPVTPRYQGGYRPQTAPVQQQTQTPPPQQTASTWTSGKF